MTAVIESRGERCRNAILGAFAQQLFRDGFENVSVQGIVREAGIARSTFYEYFNSRDDVLRASMAQFFEVLARCVSTNVESTELTAVLSHFWASRRLTDAVFAAAPRRILALSLSEMIEARLRESGEELILPLKLAGIYLAEAQLALVEGWLRGRAFARAEDIAIALLETSRAAKNALVR